MRQDKHGLLSPPVTCIWQEHGSITPHVLSLRSPTLPQTVCDTDILARSSFFSWKRKRWLLSHPLAWDFHLIVPWLNLCIIKCTTPQSSLVFWPCCCWVFACSMLILLHPLLSSEATCGTGPAPSKETNWLMMPHDVADFQCRSRLCHLAGWQTQQQKMNKKWKRTLAGPWKHNLRTDGWVSLTLSLSLLSAFPAQPCPVNS